MGIPVAFRIVSTHLDCIQLFFQDDNYSSLESIKNICIELEKYGPKITAILIEPIQGEGGVKPGEKVFFQ